MSEMSQAMILCVLKSHQSIVIYRYIWKNEKKSVLINANKNELYQKYKCMLT